MQHAAQVFISYASVDRGVVLEIAEQIRSLQIGVWIDTSGIAGGTAYGTEIANALKDSSAVVLCCSAASLDSRNVRQEIMLAWRYNKPIIPLLLESVSFPDDVAYWLEGSRWIDVFDRSVESWLPKVKQSLQRAGVLAVLSPATSTVEPEEGNTHRIQGNLPPIDSPLIGRETDVREVQNLLAYSRWITLTGTGGTGKTRLSLEIAKRMAGDFPGGTWFVDLAPIRDRDRVIAEIAKALEIREEPGTPLIETISSRLAASKTLIVLDNMEQIADVAEQIEALITSSPDLTLLVTSRAPLKSTSEWVYPVSQLGLPDLANLPSPTALAGYPSVQLFVARAERAKPDFVLSEANARAVAEICHRVEGLPLAIELAAARVRLLPPPVILNRLGSRLNVLTRGGDNHPARHQTLRDTIGWSHELLTSDEKTAFRRLAVFHGGCSEKAAEAVVTSGGEIAPGQLQNVLRSLIEHSLIRTSRPAHDADRLSMLETIREFASDELERSGEGDAMRDLHAQFMVGHVSSVESTLQKPRPGAVIKSLSLDDANIHAALATQFSSPERFDSLLAMTVTLFHYWRARGQFDEAKRILHAALDTAPEADATSRANAVSELGFIAWARGEHDAARNLHTDALSLRREANDRAGEATSLFSLAMVASSLGQRQQAAGLFQQSLEIRTDLGDQLGRASVLHHIGVEALGSGDFVAAESLIWEALDTFRGSPDGTEDLGIALDDLATIAMLKGDFENAVKRQEESLAIWRSLDDRYAVTVCLVNNGRALQLAGRSREATTRFNEVMELLADSQDSLEMSLAYYGLGLIALGEDHRERANRLLSDSLRIEQKAGEPWHIAERLEALAAVHADANSMLAARLLGAAHQLRTDTGVQMPPVELPGYEATVKAVRKALGDPEYQSAFDAGANSELHDVITEALESDSVG